MRREVANSVIVITGASTGIGRASALAFARAGANVVVTSRREEVLSTLAESCKNLGGTAMAIAADVTDEPAIHDLARRVVERFGRIDVWINNAAVTLFARFEQTPPEAYRRVIETNLFGYIHGARAVLPYFREQGSGMLINISSGVGKIGSPFISAYVASKFAIIGLSGEPANGAAGRTGYSRLYGVACGHRYTALSARRQFHRSCRPADTASLQRGKSCRRDCQAR
jgi:NAD(P)-dependent dehydrogenase (short-subunit alcohol dehydrogenase family)